MHKSDQQHHYNYVLYTYSNYNLDFQLKFYLPPNNHKDQSFPRSSFRS
jgi:hypothetical protein